MEPRTKIVSADAQWEYAKCRWKKIGVLLICEGSAEAIGITALILSKRQDSVTDTIGFVLGSALLGVVIGVWTSEKFVDCSRQLQELNK